MLPCLPVSIPVDIAHTIGWKVVDANIDAGRGAVGKRRVGWALEKKYQDDPFGEFLVRLKYFIPNEVLDEVESDKIMLVELMTRLVNEARATSFRDCKTDDELLRRAKEYLKTKKGKKWSK